MSTSSTFDPEASAPLGEPTAKRVFELFVETLRVERDVADHALLVKVRWYGEDVMTAYQRLMDDPRSARALIHHLAAVVDELELDAAALDVQEENLHQARRWALILPQIDLNEIVPSGEVPAAPTRDVGE